MPLDEFEVDFKDLLEKEEHRVWITIWLLDGPPLSWPGQLQTSDMEQELECCKIKASNAIELIQHQSELNKVHSETIAKNKEKWDSLRSVPFQCADRRFF